MMGKPNAERLLDALSEGTATLFIIETGFFVLAAEGDATLIWVAKCEGTGNYQTYMPLIEDLSIASGSEKLTLKTRRRGMSRLLGPEWRAEPCGIWTKYVKELGHGIKD